MTPTAPRTRTACTSCHAAKVRCTGTTPCARCSTSSLECIYKPSQVGRKRRRRPTPPSSTTPTTLPTSVSPAPTPDFLNDPFFAEFTLPSPPPAPSDPPSTLLRLHAALEVFDATQTMDHHLLLITTTLDTLLTIPLHIQPRTTRALLPTTVDLLITALRAAKDAPSPSAYGVYQIADTGEDDRVSGAMEEVGMAAWWREVARCRMVVKICREGSKRGCAADRARGECAGAVPDEECLGERWWERIERKLGGGWSTG